MWSAWTRTFDDGISNAMDRWYGSKGLRPENPENAAYIFNGAPGMKPLSEMTSNQKIALELAGGTVAKVLPTEKVLNYMKNDFVTGEPGAVKGTSRPDGRREN